MSTTTIDVALRRLQDHAAITDLVSRLGRWIDEQRFDGATEIFAEHVTVVTPGGVSAGLESVVAQARRNHDVPTQHVFANVLADVDGDRAEVGANVIAAFAGGPAAAAIRPGLPAVSRALGGHYRFELVRTSDGWRIARLEIEALWTVGEAV